MIIKNKGIIFIIIKKQLTKKLVALILKFISLFYFPLQNLRVLILKDFYFLIF